MPYGTRRAVWCMVPICYGAWWDSYGTLESWSLGGLTRKKILIKTMDHKATPLKSVSPLNPAKSWKIGHFQTFKVWTFVRHHQPFFGFWLFAWSTCGRIVKKVTEKIPGIKITRYYLRRHLHRLGCSRRHLCPKPPETFKFESKLTLFWLKEPTIKI